MNLDVFSFIAALCEERLVEAGYTVPAGSAEDIVLAYNNVWLHRVPVRPRSVVKAANYSLPSHLELGENLFLVDVANGADLRPYQSTRLEDASKVDGMLFDFGIQHFHMGAAAHPTKPSFRARTDPLLFALVKDDTIYCIGFFSHGAWSEKILLDAIHENWPQLLEQYVVEGAIGLAQTYTDEEHAKLRKNRINVFTVRPDGTIHLSPGGGLTLAGGSANAMFSLMQLREICDDFETQIHASIAEMVYAGKMAEPTEIELKLISGQAYACAYEIKALLHRFPVPIGF